MLPRPPSANPVMHDSATTPITVEIVTLKEFRMYCLMGLF